MKDDHVFLAHIRDAIARIESYTQEGRDAFLAKVHRGWTEQTCGLQRAVNPDPSTRFAAQEASKASM